MLATNYLLLSDIVLFLHFDWDCQNQGGTKKIFFDLGLFFFKDFGHWTNQST